METLAEPGFRPEHQRRRYRPDRESSPDKAVVRQLRIRPATEHFQGAANRTGALPLRVKIPIHPTSQNRRSAKYTKITHLRDLLTLQVYYFDNEHCVSQPGGIERVTLWNAPPPSTHSTTPP